MERAGVILTIPAGFDPALRGDELTAVIEAASDFHLAELRLQVAGLTREDMLKRGDALRELGHARDMSVVIDDHANIAQEIGLDGVQLTNSDPATLRAAKSLLGQDAIIGVSCGASKHDAMVLGEIGCDYIAFGPLGFRGFEEPIATIDLFEWWSEMIEIPVVAEGVIDASTLAKIAPFSDFVSLGEEVFGADDVLVAAQQMLAVL